MPGERVLVVTFSSAPGVAQLEYPYFNPNPKP